MSHSSLRQRFCWRRDSAERLAMLPSFSVTWRLKTRAPWVLPSRCGEDVVAKMGGIFF